MEICCHGAVGGTTVCQDVRNLKTTSPHIVVGRKGMTKRFDINRADRPDFQRLFSLCFHTLVEQKELVKELIATELLARATDVQQVSPVMTR